MKIANTSSINNTFSFKRRPNDSTYWLMKNPETATDQQEKILILSYIKAKPDWEKDEAFVHRLKQDTKIARALGKIHTEWHKYDSIPILNIPLGIFGTAYSSYTLFKNRKNLLALSKFEKGLYPAAIILGSILAASNIKYIATGRYLFEKKDNSGLTNS